MLNAIYESLLRSTGKSYKVDSRIPARLLLGTLLQRLIMVSRGLLRINRKVFLGRGVSIENRSQLHTGSGCTIGNYASVDCYGENGVRLGNSVSIGAGTIISVTSHMSNYGVGLEIGDNTGIGENAYFGCTGGVKIGSDVIMGQYVSFHSQNHNFSHPNMLIRDQGVTSRGIELGSNIWVGAKATFLDGAKVGSGCIVAAGAVVRGEFTSGAIIAGVPAKVIGAINPQPDVL